jgi:hypothetical protein
MKKSERHSIRKRDEEINGSMKEKKRREERRGKMGIGNVSHLLLISKELKREIIEERERRQYRKTGDKRERKNNRKERVRERER